MFVMSIHRKQAKSREQEQERAEACARHRQDVRRCWPPLPPEPSRLSCRSSSLTSHATSTLNCSCLRRAGSQPLTPKTLDSAGRACLWADYRTGDGGGVNHTILTLLLDFEPQYTPISCPQFGSHCAGQSYYWSWWTGSMTLAQE